MSLGAELADCSGRTTSSCSPLHLIYGKHLRQETLAVLLAETAWEKPDIFAKYVQLPQAVLTTTETNV